MQGVPKYANKDIEFTSMDKGWKHPSLDFMLGLCKAI